MPCQEQAAILYIYIILKLAVPSSAHQTMWFGERCSAPRGPIACRNSSAHRRCRAYPLPNLCRAAASRFEAGEDFLLGIAEPDRRCSEEPDPSDLRFPQSDHYTVLPQCRPAGLSRIIFQNLLLYT